MPAAPGARDIWEGPYCGRWGKRLQLIDPSQIEVLIGRPNNVQPSGPNLNLCLGNQLSGKILMSPDFEGRG
jgi:hypothetical protein